MPRGVSQIPDSSKKGEEEVLGAPKKSRARAREAPVEERRTGKSRWIEEGRLEPRKEKEGWLRFSFPHSHDSNLPEVLLLLGEAGAEGAIVIEEGLEILVSRRGKDGIWKMVGGLHGTMHARLRGKIDADLDRRVKPSPWITYGAPLAPETIWSFADRGSVFLGRVGRKRATRTLPPAGLVCGLEQIYCGPNSPGTGPTLRRLLAATKLSERELDGCPSFAPEVRS